MKRPRGRYHHGNLREELVRVSRDLIAEKSPQGFLISDAAKAAGVSPAAPYRHFSGRDDLIAAVAQEGFVRFGETLEKAAAKKQEPLDQLLAIADAYLDFASAHQGEYMAMFESGINIAGNAALNQAATAAFEPLQSVAGAVLKAMPEGRTRPPVTMVAQHIVALAHGIAELYGRTNGRFSAFSPKELLESGVRVYLAGLGVR